MQFRVPQFLETEDKVIGPLTIKQFIYVVVAFMLSAVFYAILNTWLWVALSLVLLGAAAGLAFVKINGQPLSRIAVAGFNFYWKPQTYTWREPDQIEHAASPARGGRFSLERVMAGRALKTAWRFVQTGSVPEEEHGEIIRPQKRSMSSLERYQVFQKITGEQRAARRVDYR